MYNRKLTQRACMGRQLCAWPVAGTSEYQNLVVQQSLRRKLATSQRASQSRVTGRFSSRDGGPLVGVEWRLGPLGICPGTGVAVFPLCISVSWFSF